VQQSLRLRESGTDRMGYAYCLETLAWIAASGRQYERAAVLPGAAAGLWRSMGTTLDGNQPLAGYPQVAAWVSASQPDGEGRLAAVGVQAPVGYVLPSNR
jgi:hypothetical protein